MPRPPADRKRRRTRCAWLLALAVLAVPACTRDEPSRSTTPQVVDDPSASRDTSLLLTEADVRSVAGFESATAEELKDVPVFENPDPRGPCGGTVADLPTDGAYGRAFRGNGIAAVTLLQPTTATARAYVEALKADSRRRPCPPHTSKTNTGDQQHVSDVEILDVPAGCAGCVGWVSKVTIQGRDNFGALVVFESAGTTGAIQVASATPVPASVLRALLDRALARLGA